MLKVRRRSVSCRGSGSKCVSERAELDYARRFCFLLGRCLHEMWRHRKSQWSMHRMRPVEGHAARGRLRGAARSPRAPRQM